MVLLTELHLFPVIPWILILVCCTDGKGGGEVITVSSVRIVQEGESRVGQTLRLTCYFLKIADPQSLFWYKGHNIIYANDNAEFMTERVKASSGDFRTIKKHQLIFKFLLLDDDDVYTCSVGMKDNKEYAGRHTVSIAPDTVTVMPGGATNLHCQDNGHIYYPKILMWMKYKSIIVLNGTVKANNTKTYGLHHSDLVIRNMKTTDEGTYTCYSDGKRIHAYKVKYFTKPTVVLPILRGWRGYAFGASLAVLIVGFLAITCCIQNQTPKIVDTFHAKDEI